MGKHKVLLKDLEKTHSYMEYTEFYKYVIQRVNSGSLTAIYNGETNGKSPALPVKFWENEKERDYSDVFKELDFNYHPYIKTSYYRAHPEKYQKDKKNIQLLSDYLTNKRNLLSIPETMNERSFEIFHWEKFFEKGGGLTFCKQLGITENMLNFYETSVPLAYYSYAKVAPQNILIIENEDTFYSIRKHIDTSGNNKILGASFGTIIYGSGKQISSSFKDYVSGAERYFLSDNTLLYFGDLDYEGIGIYETLQGKYSDKHIQIFVPAYEKMLDKAIKIGFENLPEMKEGQNKNIGTIFMDSFERKRQEQIWEILKADKFIPQEILNEHDWQGEN